MKPSAYPEATFLSKVTASATHELRNVLAIIKESNGLIGDMVQVRARGGALDELRVDKAAARVDAQVKRGADILSGLNRLSHCLDVARGVLDLGEEVGLVVSMSRRKARNQRQTIEVVDQSAQAQVSASPLHLQMALHAVLELCIVRFPEGSSISVGVEDSRSGPRVNFLGGPGSAQGHPELEDGDPWREAEALVSTVGARMELAGLGNGIRVCFEAA